MDKTLVYSIVVAISVRICSSTIVQSLNAVSVKSNVNKHKCLLASRPPMFVKMPFSHSLMKGFLEAFLVYSALSQSLIILREHFM